MVGTAATALADAGVGVGTAVAGAGAGADEHAAAIITRTMMTHKTNHGCRTGNSLRV